MYIAESVITEKGKTLIEIIRKSDAVKSISGVAETTRWEEKLRENPKEFVEGIKEFVREAVKTAVIENVSNETNGLGKCPVCGKSVREGKSNYYCTGYKEGCGFVIWKTTAGAEVSKSEAAALLEGKKTRGKKCKNKDGKPFSAAFRLADGKVVFEFA